MGPPDCEPAVASADSWIVRTCYQALRGFLERMTAELEDYTEAHAGGQLELLGGAEPLCEDWLIRLAGEQRGVVQFTEPQPVDVASANEAIELLWDELIIEPSRRTYPFLKKHTALGGCPGCSPQGEHQGGAPVAGGTPGIEGLSGAC